MARLREEVETLYPSGDPRPLIDLVLEDELSLSIFCTSSRAKPVTA